mgnify:CR=1 FL=1
MIKIHQIFKQIPLRKYFEKKTEYQYTRSSIHGVKGETYDAVLIYVKGMQEVQLRQNY